MQVLQLEKELESMALQMENKLDAILGEKFKLEQEIERLQESLDKINEDFKKARMEKSEALAKEKILTEELKHAKDKLKEADEALDKFKNEAASVQKELENIPKLSESKTLMYKISRLTFDINPKKENLLKGFVINPLKDDVNTFTFNTEDKAVSSHFITKYIWDLIAAGTHQEWSKF